MEGTGRKHRGFIGGKFFKSLFRTAKPASSNVQVSSRVKSTHLSSASMEDPSFTIPAPKQRVQVMRPDSITVRDSINGRITNLYRVEGDENVDTKAESYISCVQERFRNEHDGMDRRINYQEKHESGSHALTTRMALLRPLVDVHHS